MAELRERRANVEMKGGDEGRTGGAMGLEGRGEARDSLHSVILVVKSPEAEPTS